MSYNVFDLPLIGHNASSAAGETIVTLPINPGPNTWVYMYFDMRHDDATTHILSVLLLSLAGGGNLNVSESLTVTGVGLANDRVTNRRPVIVMPGERLRGLTDAMGTAGKMFIVATYVELPLGQTLDGAF